MPDTQTAQTFYDMLPRIKGIICLTDEEAELLYKAWKQSPPGAAHIKVGQDADTRYLSSLKTKGYIAGFGDHLEITPKGKKLIVEMVMHEPNSFDRNGQMPAYSGIKAKTAGRPCQTFLSKKASRSPVYNLYRKSLENMGKC